MLTTLNELFWTLVPVILTIGTIFLSIFLNTKKKEIKEKIDNEIAHKYLDMLEETIMKSVNATTQTYVEALKGKNAFDAEAQQEAFKKTYTAVLSTLTDEAKLYLNTIIGDLETYITTRIEHNVWSSKK